MRRVRIGLGSALLWDSAGPEAPWLHFGHATGMHAQLYARLLDPLAKTFNIMASDARGHGANRREAEGREAMAWDQLAAETLALMDHVQEAQPWWLVGHSLGATCALIAAVMAPWRVSGLVMLDPPFIPFEIAAALREQGAQPQNPLAEQSRRRRADFASRDEARTSYAGRGVFKQFSDADLDAYLDGGFRETPTGVQLACLPETEALSFEGVSLDVERLLGTVARQFVLLCGENGSTVPDAEFAAFANHPLCRQAERVPDTGHFLPLQAPDVVRAAILALRRG